ncbi:PIG-L family deacetylase [Variovorax sp. J22R133]|uniref:PIG-L deacetylase family protein n=1 Tax=Variovorax brevis TaxID=3053503 RepID=UPI002575C87F|nr:PIG-L family deacetylase [Variovorax sp. J22R133]MDM0114041.1 PIG-L family deacetylase [Variovorax sp. J22R133]
MTHPERLIDESDGTPEADWLPWLGAATIPAVTATDLVPEGARAVVVAPHPDDEVLACGGLLAQLAALQREICVIAVTDGTSSHPGSRQWSPADLGRIRPLESQRALSLLGVSQVPLRLGLPDGGLMALRSVLQDKLQSLLRPSDVVFTTWRLDGHPDHEATGSATALAAMHVGATLIEVPVWAWHWAAPGDARMPWARARRLVLDADASQRKRHATEAFESQLRIDATTGAPPVLRGSTVARAHRRFEVFFA